MPPFTQGENANASDFIAFATKDPTPSNDAARVTKLEGDGKIHPFFTRNPLLTNGSDGDLTISSGTTTLDLGNAPLVVKNYNDVSITGTGQLAFSNPHANGTVIILLCREFVCTSSASPAVDASGLGAAGGAAVSTSANNTTVAANAGSDGYGFPYFVTNKGTGTTGGAVPTSLSVATSVRSVFSGLLNFLIPGAGGASGAVRTFNNGGGLVTGGKGGRGGGALAIVCSGDWNFTGVISVAGAAGDSASGAGAEHSAGGGGGGGAGVFLAVLNREVANSGTITTTGGAGGAGANVAAGVTDLGGGAGGTSEAVGGNAGGTGNRNGGTGGAGFELRTTNTGYAS